MAIGVMTIGNIVPRADLKRTSLTFLANVLPLHHIGSLMSPRFCTHLSMQLFASEVSADCSTCPTGPVCLLMVTITDIQVLHILIQGRFNDHTGLSLYRIMVMATSVMGYEHWKYCA